MTADATFELKTTVDQRLVAQELSKIWQGEGYSVAVFEQPEYGDELFCYLDFIFGYPEEEAMLRECVAYLLRIAHKHMIYYYRCSDFSPLRNGFPVLEITVDDLFSEEFRPSMDASIEAKYLISNGRHSG